jgi:hypothetical protein
VDKHDRSADAIDRLTDARAFWSIARIKLASCARRCIDAEGDVAIDHERFASGPIGMTNPDHAARGFFYVPCDA